MLVLKESKNGQQIKIPVEMCVKAKIQRTVWSSTLTVQHQDLNFATQKLEEDKARVLRYFIAKGLLKEEIIFQNIQVEEIKKDQTTFFQLKQLVEINSSDSKRIEKIYLESSDLLRFNVNFSAQNPIYIIQEPLTWIKNSIPLLIQKGKNKLPEKLNNTNSQNTELNEMVIQPIYNNQYTTCEPFSNLPKDSLYIQLKANLIFVIR
jgi:hypothetical protein